jgi:hypothetical protein
MQASTADLEALRVRWALAWPGALELWSRYTQLRDPAWCVTRQQEAAAGLEGSFAMIRFVDHAVVISLRQIAERGLTDFPREILAHEIGHHVYCPGDLNDHARLIARIRAGVPGKEHHAPFLANIYGDLLINDRLQRQAGLDLAGVYRLLGGGSTDSFWTLYLRIYEILWSLKSGSLIAGILPERVDSDAHLGARLVRVYARDWLDGAGRFAALCYPYLLEDDGKGIRELLQGWHDTKNAGQGGDPGGLAEIDEGEEQGAIHPAQDPALTGIDAEGEGDSAARDEAAGRPGAGISRQGGRAPQKRYREPSGYGELLRSAGVTVSDEEATVRYYRERALPHLVPFPEKRTPRALEPLPEGLETWDRGEPLEQVDWLQSVIVSPTVVPGLTTVQRTFGTSPGEDPERVPLDLYVGIDCSGSMVDPRLGVSYPVLAGCVIALSALRAGARVMAVLSGHPGPHSATAGFVDSEREVLRILTGYLGSGYAFGIPLLAGAFAARRPTDRPVHILIVSDHDIFAMLDERTDGRTGWKIAQEALTAARGGGTFVLHMPPDWEPGKTDALRAQGWRTHGVQAWEDIVPFAREFSRRAWGGGEGEGAA